jgi:hypothetical protein
MTLPDLVALIMVDRMAALGPWCQHKCPWGANTTTRIQSNSELEKHCHYLHKNRDMRAGAFDEFLVDSSVDDELKSAISWSDSDAWRTHTALNWWRDDGSPSGSQRDPPLDTHGPGAGADVGHHSGVGFFRFADADTRPISLAGVVVGPHDRLPGRGVIRSQLTIAERKFRDARYQLALGNSSLLNPVWQPRIVPHVPQRPSATMASRMSLPSP